MSQFTEEQKIARVASIMAVSNLGQLSNLKLDHAVKLRYGNRTLAEFDVLEIAGHLIEDDNMEAVFMTEAAGWQEVVERIGLHQMADSYPHNKEWIEKIINQE